MTILNIGSINWDRVYTVDHFPRPGETLAATGASIGLGGKGLNQSIAAHRAGGQLRHVGAIGEGDTPMRAAISGFGLDDTGIVEIPGCQTGSALIAVDATGENQIILDPGANAHIPVDHCRVMIEALAPGDSVLLQNETNILADGVSLARARDLRVVVAAAPFDAARVLPLLSEIDLLSVNEIEYAQLREAAGDLPQRLSLLVTYGAQGAAYITPQGAFRVAAHRVEPVDTTGAGDTTLGSFLARLDAGHSPECALRYAMCAAALQVARPGAATAIPYKSEVLNLLHSEANGDGHWHPR